MIKPAYDYHKVPASVRVLHLAWVLFLVGGIIAMVAGYHRTDAKPNNYFSVKTASASR